METLEEFSKRMSEVEFENQYVVGRASSGNTRTVYKYEGQHCWNESFGYRTLGHLKKPATPAQMFFVASAEPSDRWLHATLIYGKSRAKKIAKYYGGYDIEEAPYMEEDDMWFSILFREFEDIMKMVYDIHTGKFAELWGKIEEEKHCATTF